jgi:hypothetical protein
MEGSLAGQTELRTNAPTERAAPGAVGEGACRKWNPQVS